MPTPFQFFKKPSLKHAVIPHKKDGRINPHLFWNMFVTVSLIILCIEVVLSVLFFRKTTLSLDAEIIPQFDSNLGEIRKVEQSVSEVEKAVAEREGNKNSTEDASQNESSIVE